MTFRPGSNAVHISSSTELPASTVGEGSYRAHGPRLPAGAAHLEYRSASLMALAVDA